MDPGSAAVVLIGIVRICFVEFAIMLAASAIFYKITPIAAVLYERFGFLENYLPILWRYRAFFDAHGDAGAFQIIFAISVANIVIQSVFLSLICVRLFGKIELSAFGAISRKQSVIFALLSVASLLVTLELIIGPDDLNSIFSVSDSHAPISPAAVYFRYCVLVPSTNILFALLVVTSFGRIGAPSLEKR